MHNDTITWIMQALILKSIQRVLLQYAYCNILAVGLDTSKL